MRANALLQDLLKKRTETYTAVPRSAEPVRPELSQSAAYPGADERSGRSIARESTSSSSLGTTTAKRQREELLTEALNEQKAEINNMAENMVEYNILKRESEANKTLYEGLLTKLKEAGFPPG